ncbi:MAG: AMP-binding protein [Candidatus Nanopelagicales bacterium]
MQVIDAGVGTRWPAAELDRRTSGAAAALHRNGVRHGDRVLLSCGPHAMTVVAYLAIRRLGAVVVPANTGYTARELEHILSDVRPVLAVVDDVARVAAYAIAARRPDELAEPPRADLPLDVAAPSDPAMIAYTSGTTGAPKGAVLSRGNLDAGAQSVVEAWRWTSDDVLVLPLPLFHMHGLGVGINGSRAAGSTVVLLPRFDVDAVIDAVIANDATMLFGVPTMWSRLADSERAAELGRLRLGVSGSAPMSAELWQRIHDRTGLEVVERYGMSETVMLTSNPYAGPRRAGTVGVPLPGVDVRLADDGGVEVRGPNVFAGYWQRADATRAAFTEDGWFRTGDIGEWDDVRGRDAGGAQPRRGDHDQRQRYLRLIGRSTDLIITGGYNVYPREVEDAVLSHPAVADCAVVGIPDESWGEVVAAFVVLATPATDTELSAHLEALLVAYKRPRLWHFIRSIPRNAMGKVVRSQLLAR